MSRGFFTIAQNTIGTNYLKNAYALALSLKATQPNFYKLAVGVTPGQRIPKEYKKVFDQVIEIPWQDDAQNSSWKLENEWKAIHMSPYDETIKLDADMLFPSSIEHWWESFNQSVVFPTNVLTFRNEIATSRYYRELFDDTDIPNVYSACFFFKKDKSAFELFQLVELITQNWSRFRWEFLKQSRAIGEKPRDEAKFSTDVAFALAIKLLDSEKEFCSTDLTPTFVHMKSKIQNVNFSLDDDWSKNLSFTLTDDLQIKIDNHLQFNPIHYHIKNLITSEIIETYITYLDSYGTKI